MVSSQNLAAREDDAGFGAGGPTQSVVFVVGGGGQLAGVVGGKPASSEPGSGAKCVPGQEDGLEGGVSQPPEMACPGSAGEVGLAIAPSLDEAGEEWAEQTGDRVATFGQHSRFGPFEPGQQEVVLGGVEQREGAVLRVDKAIETVHNDLPIDSAIAIGKDAGGLSALEEVQPSGLVERSAIEPDPAIRTGAADALPAIDARPRGRGGVAGGQEAEPGLAVVELNHDSHVAGTRQPEIQTGDDGADARALQFVTGAEDALDGVKTATAV